MSGVSGVTIAYVAIYTALVLPAQYILFKHGKNGLLAWLYLSIFCILRLVGNALQIRADKDHNASMIQTATIISSIGLSPLLLTTSGLLHEARHYRSAKPHSCCDWIVTAQIHGLIATGTALIAAGLAAFKPGPDVKASSLTLAKAGVAVLIVAWVSISLWGVYLLLPRLREKAAAGYRDGTKLLYVALLSLPFTGIRIMTGAVYIFTRSADLNPVTGTLGFRVGLDLIPELITILAFVFVGIATRNVAREI